MIPQITPADYEALAEEFRHKPIYETMRTINTHLCVSTPNGALNHKRDAFRASIPILFAIVGIITNDPDTFEYLEKKNPEHHEMALGIVRSAREKYGVAV